jgi:Meiotically up-regulated gene 113
MENASVIYFVKLGKFIKIGVTTNLTKRLKVFRTTMPFLQMLLTVPGGRELEKKLHHLLQKSRIDRSELFRDDDGRVDGFISHFKYGGLPRAIEYLENTTPARRIEQAKEEHKRRVAERRMTKREMDMHCAALVAERKRQTGW